jgi:membrane protease YdiL (CAAX protease family)
MTFLVYASLRQNPMIWLHDAPPDVRERFGEIDDKTKRQRSFWVVVMLVILLAVFVPLAYALWPQGKVAVYLGAWVCFQVFNLYDALVIDLYLVLVRPAWAFPKGAEESPSYRDPRWHLLNWLKGFFGGFVFAALVLLCAWLVALVRSLLG